MSVYEPRERWGATGSPGGYRIGEVSEVIVHHFYKPHLDAHVTVERERDVMRSVQNFHEGKGWADIGYQFVVFQSGRAYEGRGWFQTGAHTAGRNSKSVGVAFAINGDERVPTTGAWAKAREVLAEGVRVGALARDYDVNGHTDYANKSCPGTRTYPMIDRLKWAGDAPVGRNYAQAVVVYSDIDLEHGRVLAQTYDLGLCRIDSRTGDLVSVTHPGAEAHVDFAFLVGQAASRAGHLPLHGAIKLTGPDRDATARKVGQFIESHPKETMQRRGKPWR